MFYKKKCENTPKSDGERFTITWVKPMVYRVLDRKVMVTVNFELLFKKTGMTEVLSTTRLVEDPRGTRIMGTGV